MPPESNDTAASHRPAYQPAVGAYDEMADAAGTRPHWRRLLEAFERLGPEELAARRDAATRILREHGVTYNLHGDSQGLGRPWALDLVPLLIPAGEWKTLEAGLLQRTRLLNLILGDFYGPQQLLRSGLLPPEIVQANPGFLRPCHGYVPPRRVFLSLHAVDLARAPDGRWWVLSDRTQAPAGVGYALENRAVLSRVLADEYRDYRAERLSVFFQTMRDTLRCLPLQASDQPHAVMLTPGPYSESYSEHVYLARHLGFPLVEGADLTVRDRRVFLKTLEGLQPVDVILRRTDDLYCDPLELKADSFLGVPGLVEAVRAGNVAVANALGSGAVEAPALAAFLPGLARNLVGEDLLLPSVATWWCGQENEAAHVRENLDDLVIRRAFARDDEEPVFGAALDRRGREALLAALAAEPHAFVGQERLISGTAPVWEGNRMAPLPMVLRAYVAATPDGFTVMPGGLARFSSSPGRLVEAMLGGGGSKDTWVEGDADGSQMILTLPNAPIVRLERADAELPSRVADNLYWLGRYAERLEDTLRLLRGVLVLLAGDTGSEESPELTALVRVLARLEVFPAQFCGRHTLAAVEREVGQLIYQTNRLGAVSEIQARLHQIAFVLRDRFSADTWRILNKLRLDSRPQSIRTPAAEMLAQINTLIADLAAFAGMEMENMTRGHGWRFLDIGRRIERTSNIVTLLGAALAADAGGGEALEPVLEIADSVMTHRSRYFAGPQWATVLDLLLADASNPRSLAFQIAALSDHMDNLPRVESCQEAVSARALCALVVSRDWSAMAEAELSGADRALGALLDRFGNELRALSDALTNGYFNHATARVS
jgi:uncharacterized circularly permuted ATP-grasp superfamily protein/uncharacterized alpha-E superfamily protein